MIAYQTGNPDTETPGWVDSDQDFLNWFYRDRWFELPFTYNMRLRGLLSTAAQLQDPMRVKVFHFAGTNTKPWDRSRWRELTYFSLMWWLVHDRCVAQGACSSLY
jgi:lipopolysaccharide biosynthesis glycosyltransferase